MTEDDKSKKVPIISGANTHRLVRTLIEYETELETSELKFSKTIATILKKDMKTHLVERSSFVILSYLEKEKLAGLITKDDITDVIIKKAKKAGAGKGLELIEQKLNES